MVMIKKVGSGLVPYDHGGLSSSNSDLYELVSSKISRELFELVPVMVARIKKEVNEMIYIAYWHPLVY